MDDKYYTLFQTAATIDLKNYFLSNQGNFCGKVILQVKAISPVPVPDRLKNAALYVDATTYPISLANDYILSIYGTWVADV